MSTIVRGLETSSRVEAGRQQAANFVHLYWDIAWYGITFGSTLSFLAVFLTRLGAAGWQVGLLTAGPALVNVLFTLPAGRWLENRALGPAVTWTAIFHRLGYFVLIPLPLILPAQVQIWAVLIITLLMAIPGAALVIGFNALLAATVPPKERGAVVGRRNALLAGTIMASFLFSGWLLDQLSFDWGYVVVFALGALGVGMSTYHISRIQVPETPRQFKFNALTDHAQPGRLMGFSGALPHRLTLGVRLWLKWRPGHTGIFKQVSAQYRWVMVAFFLFHFSQFLPAAIFPIFLVRQVRLSDGEIGWTSAIFYLTMLLAAPLLGRLTHRWGNYRLTVSGAILLSLYPLLIGLSQGVTLIVAASVVGGTVWGILSGALANRLLEHVPDDNRPPYLAIYNIVLSLATLIGTMLGPFVADVIGLREMLLLVFLLRIGSGAALARWG